MVRSGDYYLFETDSEEEEEDEEKKDDDSPKKSAFQVKSKQDLELLYNIIVGFKRMNNFLLCSSV